MPVVFAVTTPDGKQTYKVWIRSKEKSYEFPHPQKPLLVSFDEGNHLLKELTFPKTIDELEFQLKQDDVLGRMWAAGQLSQHQNDSGVKDSVRASAAGDSFWAV